MAKCVLQVLCDRYSSSKRNPELIQDAILCQSCCVNLFSDWEKVLIHIEDHVLLILLHIGGNKDETPNNILKIKKFLSDITTLRHLKFLIDCIAHKFFLKFVFPHEKYYQPFLTIVIGFALL